MDKYLIHSCYR